jgi:carboxylesterase
MSNLLHVLRESMSTAEHDPIRLPGRSPVFLLVHGFMGTPREWRPLADVLHEAGYAVQAPLLPGFGPELAELSRMSLRDWIATLHATARDIAPSPIILVGFSFGGALSTILAPIIAPIHLVLLAPFSHMPLPVWYRRLLPLFALFSAGPRPFARIDFDDPRVQQAFSGWNTALDVSDPLIRRELRSLHFPWSLLRELDEIARQARAAASQVLCPVTIVQGRADQTVRLRDTRRFARFFPSLELYIETPGDHQIVVPTHPGFRLLTQILLDRARGADT